MQVPCFADELLAGIDSGLQFTLAQVNRGADGVALRAGAAVARQAERDRFLSCFFGWGQLPKVTVDASSMPPEAAFVELKPFGIGLAAFSDQGDGAGGVIEGAMRLPGIANRRAGACLHGRLHRQGPRSRDMSGDATRTVRKVDRVLQTSQMNSLMAHGSHDPAREQ